MPLQRKPLPVVADSAAYAKASGYASGYDPTRRRAKGYWFLDIYPPLEDWKFMDFTIRAFLNIQHPASSIDLVKATVLGLSS